MCSQGGEGQIVSFQLTGGLRTELNQLSPAIHQIAFIGDRLFATDTANNRLVVWHEGSKTVRPFEGDRLHLNSVSGSDDRIYVIAHRQTIRTQRCSQIYELDQALDLLSVRDIPTGGCCHNYYKDASVELVCNSLLGTLQNHGQDVAVLGCFTRGLGITPDHYLVGGSEFAHDRALRNGEGRVIVLDKTFKRVATIEIAGVQVMDLLPVRTQ